MEKILLSKKEAAVLLSISLRIVENLIAAKLDSRRIGRRRLIRRASLERLARRDVPSASLHTTELRSTAGNIEASSQP